MFRFQSFHENYPVRIWPPKNCNHLHIQMDHCMKLFFYENILYFESLVITACYLLLCYLGYPKGPISSQYSCLYVFKLYSSVIVTYCGYGKSFHGVWFMWKLALEMSFLPIVENMLPLVVKIWKLAWFNFLLQPDPTLMPVYNAVINV